MTPHRHATGDQDQGHDLRRRRRVDFEGTCAQVKRNLNCPYSSTLSAVLSCVKSGADQPGHSLQRRHGAADHGEGAYGSLMNPRPPAPVRARMVPAFRAYNAVMKALAQALPIA